MIDRFMISINSFLMAHVSDSDDIVAKLLTESFSRLSYNDKLEWQVLHPKGQEDGLCV